jgi:hypothetical protein
VTYAVRPEGKQPADMIRSPQDPVRNPNYVAEGIFRTRQKYKNLPRFNALLTIYLEPLQELEGVFFDILESRIVDSARKAQLDIIGRILGLGRGSWDDDTYRVYLRVQLRVLRSSGTAPELIAILRLIVAECHLKEVYPAALEIDVVTDIGGGAIGSIMQRAKSAGVRVDTFVYATDVFEFSATGVDEDTSAIHGLADVDETTGGRLTGVY